MTKVITRPIYDMVSRVVQESYGPDYSATKDGQIRVRNDSLPYDRYAGNWWATHDTVIVVLNEPTTEKP